MSALALVFQGPMNPPATTKLRNAICAASNERLTPMQGQAVGPKRFDTLFLLMSSPGGSLEEGFALYGLLRSVPIKVITVNIGIIASIATVPFLAGTDRIAYPHSRFHFHNFEWYDGAPHNLTRLEFEDHTQLIDTGRAGNLDLLKAHTALTDEDLQTLKLLDLPTVKDAVFAQEKGIVQSVQFPVYRADTVFLNVDY
jgi:ATP-dependent protease ClpP protease subunit